MPGLAFLHPALLWGLTLGAIPILLHLLQRRRYRVRRWAAMEFLRASVRRSSRRLRIEQWLLLLVRALILMLAALALARPVWHSPRWGWLGSRAAAQVVLVLNDSYSMGWHGARGPTQAEQARERALELIQRGLTPGDSVAVVLASEPARALVRRPTFNLAGVSTQVRRVPLSDRRSDLAGAARVCLEILRSSRAAVREVYLVTNTQAPAWRRPDVADGWRRVAQAARLHLVPTLPARGTNLAVDEVRVGGPVLPERAVPIQARLSNHGDQPARGVVVTLHADGQAVTSVRTDIPAEGAAEVRFEHAFATPGPHTVMVALPPDGLAIDDRGYASLDVRQRTRVLILNGHPDPDPRRDAAFYLTAALAPDGAGNEEGPASTGVAPFVLRPSSFVRDPDASRMTDHASPFAVRVIDGSSFRGTDLSALDVVVLADVPRLSEPERRALAGFVADGGGLLIAPGPSALPQFYNGDLLVRRPALMPARLGPARDAGGTGPGLEITRADHPALARFQGAADVDLTSARFPRYFGLGALDAGAGARIVCRFTDGSPALAERGAGLGRVVLLASPFSPGWNTLPFKPAFLPFLHGLIAYLGEGPGGERNLRVGEPLIWALPGDRRQGIGNRGQGAGQSASWLLEGPEGQRVALRPTPFGEGGAESSIVRLDNVPHAGLYHLVQGPEAVRSGRTGLSDRHPPGSARGGQQPAGVSAGAWFAVNLRTDESDLRALSRRELEGMLSPAAARWVDSHESLAAVVREGRHGREAWQGLLIAALLLMLCESGMAQLFGRRRENG